MVYKVLGKGDVQKTKCFLSSSPPKYICVIGEALPKSTHQICFRVTLRKISMHFVSGVMA